MTLSEMIFLVGLTVFAAGLGFIYWPLALLFVGAAMVTFSYLHMRTTTGKAPSPSK